MSTPTPTLQSLAIRLSVLEAIVNRQLPQTVMSHKTHTVEIIQQIVCDEFNLNTRTLLGPRRLPGFTWPRHIAMALSYEFTGLSTMEIAPLFHRLDHGTVLHACNRVRREEFLKTKSAAIMKRLRERITAALTLPPIK